MARGTIGTTLVMATFALLGTVPGAKAQGAAPNCEGSEHRQFDFWIGDWDVTANGKPAGHNRIEKILNGCVLQENWEGAGGGTGKSFNMYDRRDGKWKQTWVDGQGSRLDLSGSYDAEKKTMTLTGTTPGQKPGVIVQHEIAWTQLPDGTVRQHWRLSRDGGATWTDAFDGIYKKSPD